MKKLLAVGLFLALALSLVIGMGFGGSSAGAQGPKINGEYVPGELVVKFKDGVTKSAKDRILGSDNLSVLRTSQQLKFNVVEVPSDSTVPEMVARLSADPRVEYAEPNYIDRISMTPDDPLYPDQWHMQGFASGGIDATTAWDTEEGDPSVIVAVVDTGVAFENYGTYVQAPDLAGTTFVSPHDSVDGDAHPVDDVGHGTHVTGTIAQTTNNALGTTGAAHGCTIMPVRCLGPGGGSHAMMADAFAWAADHGAKVINYSAGGSDSQTKRDGCRYAYEAGVTICVSSGNDSGAIQYPAAYSEYCIAVGATARDKTFAYYSNFGPQQCVVGPGGDVRYTSADGVIQQTYNVENDPTSGFGYHGWMGTSMACPHVSAAAALFISNTGMSNPDAVKMQLELTAHDLGGAGRDDYFGYGLVDANQALTPAVPMISAIDPESGPEASTVTINGINFGVVQGASSVSFNGVPATDYTSWSETEVVVLVPVGATTGPVTVTTSDGTSNGVEFALDAPAPTVTGIAPASGTNDGTISITDLQGTGFRAGASVRLTKVGQSDIVATDVAVVSPQQITCTLDLAGSATGQWNVIVTNDDAQFGTLTDGFTVGWPAPTVTSISPSSGGPGTVVTVTDLHGSGFRAGAEVKLARGGQADIVATDIVVVSPQQITCTIDLTGAVFGLWNVIVTNDDAQSAELTDSFTVGWPAPTISSITPSSGINNGSVSITDLHGSGFRAGATVKLTRSGQADINASVVTVANESKITCSFNLVGAAVGQWNVVVTNDDAQAATRANGFTVGYPSPTVSSIAPSSWPTGQAVNITNLAGSNFRAGATVRLKKSGTSDIVASNVRIVSSTKITCTFNLAGAAQGARSVYVTNTDGKSGVKSNAFTVGAPVYPVWYLAEGSCAAPFATYVSIENPNSTAVHAVLVYMTTSGTISGGTVTLPARSQATINPASKVGAREFSTRVICSENKTICVDRTMVWTGPGAASPEGHNSVGVSAPAKTWYLPEGSSAWGFDCRVALMNPSPSTATVKVTYMIEGGSAVTKTKTVGAYRRFSFNMASDIGSADASIKVESNVAVVPERAMYRNNMREGHCSIGTTTPSTSYYLAEGTSAWGFTSYVLVQNANTAAASVTVTYMTETGPVVMPAFTLAAKSRKTIRVNDVLPGKDFSVRVQGSRPIIAERAMYWNNGTGETCHDSIGLAAPHGAFYCPDGQSSSGLETWTLVQNPNSSSVVVEITYMTPTGSGTVAFTDTVAANSRTTFALKDRIPNSRAAIRVVSKTSGKKIMVERAMYWNNRGAGTDSIGGYVD